MLVKQSRSRLQCFYVFMQEAFMSKQLCTMT